MLKQTLTHVSIPQAFVAKHVRQAMVCSSSPVSKIE